jgi:2-polyprenyl-6-methoxyphenol hydroxylase-like FAD-dependent oxidoreductase
MTTDTEDLPHVPVLIVGSGPVGLALSGDLGKRGVETMLVEKTDGTIYQPKMDLVGVRTMEFCRRWGIAEWVEASPYPRDYLQDYIYVTTLTGWELSRERFPTKNDEQKPVQSPQKRERCPQDMFDPILRRFVAQVGKTDLRYECELISFEQFDDGVVSTLRQSGATYQVRSDYLVGCDGPTSTVRAQLGIPMIGPGVLTYTTNIIFRCPDLVSLHDKGEGYRFIFIGPEGTYATLVAINGGDRWRFSIVGDGSPRRYSENEVREAIVRAVGRDFDFDVLSIVPWTRRELVAERYQDGRVFIAGDSAHVTSPTGGFGMNTGIQDAVDLSWKITATLQGWAGDDILSSYQTERKPVAERNVAEAGENLRRMLSPRYDLPPQEVFEPGTVGDQAREAYGKKFADIIRPEWFTIGIHLGYRYDHSPIVVSEDGTPPTLEVASYQQSTWPGGRAPHVWLEDGSSTLDAFGDGFTLVRLGLRSPTAEDFIAAAEELGVPLKVVDWQQPDVVAIYERKLVLVRPDGHVAWRSDETPDDPRIVLETVSGRVPSNVGWKVGS